MRGSGRLLLPAIQSQTITGLLLAFSSTAPRAAGLVALVVLRPPPPSHFGGWHSHRAEGIVRCSPRSTAITPALAYAERTSRLAWSSRSRLSTMASQPDSFGFREPSTAAPSRYAQDKSEWKEGSKPGFSVVADYGTADDIEVPADAIETGDGPLRVKLPKLLQLLDPVRFPSSSTAKKKVRQGVVLVNGNKGRVDTDITIGSDHVKLQARTESKFQARGEAPFPITVIYEDDVMAIVHKPPGICTHPPKCLVPQTQAQSMMSMRCCVPYHVPCAPPGSEGILWRPMMAHRLDKVRIQFFRIHVFKHCWVSSQMYACSDLETYLSLSLSCSLFLFLFLSLSFSFSLSLSRSLYIYNTLYLYTFIPTSILIYISSYLYMYVRLRISESICLSINLCIH